MKRCSVFNAPSIVSSAVNRSFVVTFFRRFTFFEPRARRRIRHLDWLFVDPSLLPADHGDPMHELSELVRREDAAFAPHIDRKLLIGVLVDHDAVVAEVEIEQSSLRRSPRVLRPFIEQAHRRLPS
jgi:hypothetical protein